MSLHGVSFLEHGVHCIVYSCCSSSCVSKLVTVRQLLINELKITNKWMNHTCLHLRYGSRLNPRMT